MGNCVCRRKPETWADDDDDEEAVHWIKPEESEELSARRKEPSAPSTEVRIRISKKQLEELLRRAEAKGLPTGDVMKDLINMSISDSKEIIHEQCHWRPALKSIEEEPDA